MAFFGKKKKTFLSKSDTERLVNAIRNAELQTSGEIRVFIESHCKYVDAIDRARQIFDGLEMEKTALRNAVLFYVAIHDKQMAIFADTGIHDVTPKTYWKETIDLAVALIKSDGLTDGLIRAVTKIGAALHDFFPYDGHTDKNELPDDIVFGN